jgi:hypothetical protein
MGLVLVYNIPTIVKGNMIIHPLDYIIKWNVIHFIPPYRLIMEGNYDAHFLNTWVESEWACSPLIMYKNQF